MPATSPRRTQKLQGDCEQRLASAARLLRSSDAAIQRVKQHLTASRQMITDVRRRRDQR
jgi:hypothetical protein